MSNSQPFHFEHMGPLSSWSELVYPRPQGGAFSGKGFLGVKLGLTGMEVSLNSLPPGASYPFAHAHKLNEELYLFLTGSGEMILDDQVIAVGPGSAVRVAPPVSRCWRSTGTEPLTCVVVQAQAGSLTQATAADGFRTPEPRWP